MSSADADRRELRALVATVRANLEWLQVSGADGVPRGSEAGGDRPASSSPVVRADALPPASPLREHEGRSDREASAPSSTEPALGSAEPGVAGASGSPQRTAEALRDLEQQVASCTLCPLHQGRIQTVFSRGSGRVRLCFVGEGPGQEEDEQGTPFVGKAGQLLDRMIAAMGLVREDVYVCNIVKCRPPGNRKPEPDEMSACLPFLRQQLRLVDPEVIVALGATAVQGLLGTTEGITRLRGRWRLYDGTVAVMPTFHPAYLLRNPSAKAAVWQDLQAVLRQMGLEPPGRG
jgi:uracil-DNA glycosylase family 4